MEPFIGQIQMFGFNFAPRGWALCNGQLLAISQNTALFSLLGTIYGGDGRTTFGLPDLRGRVAIHMGNGAGLSNRTIGSRAGTQVETLSVAQMPNHGHHADDPDLFATANPANTSDPTGAALAMAPAYNNTDGLSAELGDGSVEHSSVNAGGSAAHNNMQPFLTVNFCIALVGIFPSRS